ncbi:hypothetical protein JW898_00360 [Candidatus Woesearchaeota archaeon]|nr:hypothetical protein [Candidatus Woesearchaeota archaeon]
MLSKKDIVEANRQFSTGKVMNESSLDFAVHTSARSKNWLRSSAVFTRAILIDHVFEDGNKRTAAAVIMSLMELNKVLFDPELVAEGVIRILMRNITSIREIERCIKDAVR